MIHRLFLRNIPIILLLLILLNQAVQAAHRKKAATLSPFLLAVRDELREKKIIRDISCGGFSNLILNHVGLPRLGQDAPVLGVREDLDRMGQYENPPAFVDSTLRSERPYLEYRVTAHGNPSTRDIWYLELSRIRESSPGKRVELKTQFAFQISSAANRQSCELTEINFQEPSGKIAGSYDADRCLELFDPAVPSSGNGVVARSVLEQDCAFGLRYFLSMKWPR